MSREVCICIIIIKGIIIKYRVLCRSFQTPHQDYMRIMYVLTKITIGKISGNGVFVKIDTFNSGHNKLLTAHLYIF